MNKQKLVTAIISQLELDLKAAKAAALETYAAATGEESQPENEYDTRALEASYLAGAQAKRVIDIDSTLGIYKQLKVRDFTSTSKVAATALVDLSLNDKTLRVFLVPVKGGMTINFEGTSIQVITPNSPLGGALLGLSNGEVATVDTGKQILEYEIRGIE